MLFSHKIMKNKNFGKNPRYFLVQPSKMVKLLKNKKKTVIEISLKCPDRFLYKINAFFEFILTGCLHVFKVLKVLSVR